MRPLASAQAWLCVAATAALVGCGGSPEGGDANVVSCKVEGDKSSQCMEYVDPKSDTYRLSILDTCKDGGGVLVETCPTEDLVGICEQPQDTEKAWTLSRVVRVHHYLHPDIATPDAIDAIADRCSDDNTWTPADGGGTG